MNKQVKKHSWSLLSTLVAVGTSMLLKKSMEKGWEKTTKKKAPKTPTESNVDWKEAIVWAVISGLLVSVAKLATTKITHDGWKKLLGESPDDY